MSYTVDWKRRAEAQLAALWIRANNKGAIVGYAEQIERALARDPLDFGESRSGTTRIAFFRPLCVVYHVDGAARAVHVLGIKWVGM